MPPIPTPNAIPLARLPTPLEQLPRLSRSIGVDLWIKRDDLTGLGEHGNKVRKLERIAADALAAGADLLITCGGIQSNHCRATAVVARRLGLDVHLLLRGDRPAVPEGNLLLDTLLGAEISWCDADAYRHRRGALLAALADEAQARGYTPYVIPEGGSNALGALAYADAAAEVAPDRFDAVVVAVGSGGTLAGLVVGPDIGPLHGVAVCDDAAYFTARVQGIVDETNLAFGRRYSGASSWVVHDAWRGPAYGVADPPTWSIIRRAARLEGLLLDPVYTGKAMLGLSELVANGTIGGRVLFWHTGGAFGLFGRGHEVSAS